MKKIIIAIAAHILVIVATITVISVFFSRRIEGESVVRFTGVIEENVIIRVLENDTAIKQGYLKELLDAFNKEYAEYGIVAQDANMDQYSDLEKDGPFGYGPDVLYQANDRLMKYVTGKHIQPLPMDSFSDKEKIDEKAWEAYRATVGGEDYCFGVPVNVQGPILYYRKDLLPADWQTVWDDDKNDIPDMLENWNDMFKYSQQVKAASNGKKYGYMRSFLEPYFSVGYLFSYGGYIFGKNNTDIYDIGFSKGNAEKGASVIRQLAGTMNEGCLDDTITVTAYSKLAKGDFFATITTPDVYTLFITELMNEGMTREQAVNCLGSAPVPKLPASGNLSEESPELIPNIMLGGVNGYAISSYTESPNASLEFVKFATNYEMIKLRNELLGIAPARSDVAGEVGGLSKIINENLIAGQYVIMPSIKEIAQIWTPCQTLFPDIAKDAFRKPGEKKFETLELLKSALESVDRQIYDAIHTLRQ